MCVRLRNRAPRGPQCAATVRVAKGREWARRLTPALALACLAIGLFAEGVLAASFVLNPIHGLATASVTATYTYGTAASCPVGKIFISFWWVTPNTPIANRVPVGIDATGANCVAVVTFVPAKVPGAVTTPNKYLVYGSDATAPGPLSFTYVIDSPPPPPSPTPTATPPPPTTPPPTTALPTTPPPTHAPTPPPTHPPTSIPTPIITPTPRCTTEDPARGCVPVDCTRLTAAFLPVGGDGGLPPLMFALFLVAGPGIAFAVRTRRLSKLAVPMVLLLMVSTSCARLASVANNSPTPVAPNVVGFEATPDCRGYWMASSSDGIFPFGSAQGLGSTGNVRPNRPIIGMESTPDGQGYWLVASDGGIFPFGDALGFGSTGNVHLNRPIVAMEDTPDGGGYWLVASDGGIFPFGDAAGYGSTGNVHLNRPIVDMEATPRGRGYWLVASDGGIFPFGDAQGFGGTGNIQLNEPIVGMDSTPDGAGYWLVAADGGIFPLGDAQGFGSTGNVHLNRPIVGMEATPDGLGYWLVAGDGGVFPFGDATGYGVPSSI